MSEVYGMRRANGDWFALDDHGRLRVPVFRSSDQAMRARARNSGMLLFKRVELDERALNDPAPCKDRRRRLFLAGEQPAHQSEPGSPSRARAACPAQTRGRGTAVR